MSFQAPGALLAALFGCKYGSQSFPAKSNFRALLVAPLQIYCKYFTFYYTLKNPTRTAGVHSFIMNKVVQK